MTQNSRYWLLVCNVAAVMSGTVAWIIPASNEPGVWWFRIGALVVLILTTALFLRNKRRRDQVPDFLSRLSGNFFERDGFTFVVTTEVHAGVCHLCVWYQNRYERDCNAEVMVRTSERWLAPQRHLPDVRVKILCSPAGFGKALVPWPLPLELQGRKVLLDVMARRKYNHGRGRLLRYKPGLAVGSTPFSKVSDVLSILEVVSLHGGRRAARTQLLLPQNVASNPLSNLQEQTQTIWKLGDALNPTAADPSTDSVRALQATSAA